MRAALCHHYDVSRHTVPRRHRSRDHLTQHRQFPIRPQQKSNRISLGFHDVITDVITPGSIIIHVDPIDAQHRKTIMLKDRQEL